MYGIVSLMMNLVNVASATYCVGPLCYISDHEEQNSVKPEYHPKPNIGTSHLLSMLYTNIWENIKSYAGSAKNSAYESIITNYLTLINVILVAIALITIGK